MCGCSRPADVAVEGTCHHALRTKEARACFDGVGRPCAKCTGCVLIASPCPALPLQHTRAAMGAVGLSQLQQCAVLQGVAAVMHLGNIGFEQVRIAPGTWHLARPAEGAAAAQVEDMKHSTFTMQDAPW